MTTERREAAREPLLRVSPLELRLYVAAFLAAVYAISWRVVSGDGPDAATVPVVGEPVPPPEPQVVWLDSVGPAMRPTIALPAGWRVASAADAQAERAQAAPAQPAPTRAAPRAEPPPAQRIVRAPSHRARRVRTRSS